MTLVDKNLTYIYDHGEQYLLNENNNYSSIHFGCVKEKVATCNLKSFEDGKETISFDVKHVDDLGNAYWITHVVPWVGEARTIFVREVNTYYDDTYYITGGWLGFHK